MANRVLDERGFVRENMYLVLSFPMWQGILAYRIQARVNKNFEKINYGILPVDGDGDGVNDGIVLANASSGRFGFSWAILPVERRADMFWYDDRTKLKQVKIKVDPFLFRNFIFITTGIQQASYQGIAVADETTPSDFGYWRGTLELPILPYMHIQMSSFNPLNMNLIGDCQFEYAEYSVELVKDPVTLFNMMLRRSEGRDAHWLTLPGETKFPTDTFVRAYNIEQPIPLSRRLEEVRRSVAEYMGGA